MSGALARDAALVAVGGALGSLSRWGVAHVLPGGSLWHWPTFAVNALGACLLGLLLEFLTRPGAESTRVHTVRLLVGTGLLGGFTTYSAFAEEMWQQVDAGDSAGAFGYAVVTLGVGLLAAAFGVLAGGALRDRSAAGPDDSTAGPQRSAASTGDAPSAGSAANPATTESADATASAAHDGGTR